MRGLGGLAALLLVPLVPLAGAQATATLTVELDEVTAQAPLPAHGRLPTEQVIAFTVAATVRMPADALCVGRVAIDFTAASLPSELLVELRPARLLLELRGEAAPAAGQAWSGVASAQVMGLFSPRALAFEPKTFRLAAHAYPAGDAPCNVQDAYDAVSVTWIPDFRPEFALERMPQASDRDPARVQVVNLANADARFSVEYGRSGAEWVPAASTFRLEPAFRTTSLDRTVLLLDGATVPFGFDGRVRVTQRAADDSVTDAPAMTQEIDVGATAGEAGAKLYAREEAPNVPALGLVGILVVAAALMRRHGPSNASTRLL